MNQSRSLSASTPYQCPPGQKSRARVFRFLHSSRTPIDETSQGLRQNVSQQIPKAQTPPPTSPKLKRSGAIRRKSRKEKTPSPKTPSPPFHRASDPKASPTKGVLRPGPEKKPVVMSKAVSHPPPSFGVPVQGRAVFSNQRTAAQYQPSSATVHGHATGPAYQPSSPAVGGSRTSAAYSPTSPLYYPTLPDWSRSKVPGRTAPQYVPSSPVYYPSLPGGNGTSRTTPAYAPTAPLYSPSSPAYDPSSGMNKRPASTNQRSTPKRRDTIRCGVGRYENFRRLYGERGPPAPQQPSPPKKQKREPKPQPSQTSISKDAMGSQEVKDEYGREVRRSARAANSELVWWKKY